jgi:hypothetical protein
MRNGCHRTAPRAATIIASGAQRATWISPAGRCRDKKPGRSGEGDLWHVFSRPISQLQQVQPRWDVGSLFASLVVVQFEISHP